MLTVSDMWRRKGKVWSGCLAAIQLEASFADVGGKVEVVQPGGSYDFRHEIDTRGSDGGTSPVVD